MWLTVFLNPIVNLMPMSFVADRLSFANAGDDGGDDDAWKALLQWL
jgi:hypothetical protein